MKMVEESNDNSTITLNNANEKENNNEFCLCNINIHTWIHVEVAVVQDQQLISIHNNWYNLFPIYNCYYILAELHRTLFAFARPNNGDQRGSCYVVKSNLKSSGVTRVTLWVTSQPSGNPECGETRPALLPKTIKYVYRGGVSWYASSKITRTEQNNQFNFNQWFCISLIFPKVLST